MSPALDSSVSWHREDNTGWWFKRQIREEMTGYGRAETGQNISSLTKQRKEANILAKVNLMAAKM
jgi:hypothetical protein